MIEVRIVCDGCGAVGMATAKVAGQPRLSPTRLRALLRAKGWRYEAGIDYCQECPTAERFARKMARDIDRAIVGDKAPLTYDASGNDGFGPDDTALTAEQIAERLNALVPGKHYRAISPSTILIEKPTTGTMSWVSATFEKKEKP